jgi:cysteinyl-tRNA synthetase
MCEQKMAIKIYNSLTRKKEEFQPQKKGKIRMYVCGMTVYSDAHIGHARTYFAFDMIRRYFEYKGYDVNYIQNITDVDDKIINAANEKGVDPLEYSKKFSDRCLQDLDQLGIRRADSYPRASETIPDMIKMIENIIDKGYGYEADGDVYFSVEKFPEYGKLSGQNVQEMKSGARIEPGEKKQSPLDFALWKKAKPGEPAWDSPWGKGRPGWHIECSAMSSKHLGLPFDIHGGGMDLRFPHHENEIAQAEAATDKQFARFWMHIGLLTVDGEKMSKSLGNIVNIRELLEKWDPEMIRFFFAQAHYRSPPDFSKKALRNSEKALKRIYRLKEKLEQFSEGAEKEITQKSMNSLDKDYLEDINEFKEKFEESMDDDFNTPQAVAVLFDFINKSNRYLEKAGNSVNKSLCKHGLEALVIMGKTLTLFQGSKKKTKTAVNEETMKNLKEIIIKFDGEVKETEDINVLMDSILQLREEARLRKEWSKADEIRDSLESLGFEIQDTSDGAVWRKR